MRVARCWSYRAMNGRRRMPRGHQQHSTSERKAFCCSSASSYSLFSTVSGSSSEEPFYGFPRPLEEDEGGGIAVVARRVRLLMENASTALADPTRADAVAAVGEITGTQALRNLLRLMQDDPSGYEILLERPIVSKDTIPYKKLIARAKKATSLESGATNNGNGPSPTTFGQAYGTFLAAHGFDPDGRDPIRHIEDPDLSYVMLRYRQCHDYWHTLTGLPPTVAGELGLKWLELFQTGLPLTALSSTAASLLLDPRDRRLVWGAYLPWAYHVSKRMKFGSLMMVHYEKEFDTPLDELRDRMGIVPAPLAGIAEEHTNVVP